MDDYTSNFISHNRRAINAQINGHFNHILSYQIFAGDSISSSGFKDSQQGSGAELQEATLAYGGKVRLSPFIGWEDKDIKETYMGKGKHFSLGAGYFRADSIKYRSLGNDYTLDRSLINYEASLHYKNINLIAEYFYLHGQIDSFNQNNIGSSKGYYFLAEYNINKINIAPFARYEKWNQFIQSGDTTQYSRTYGINWYLNKNKMRFGISHSQTDNERSGNHDDYFQLYSMFNI